MTTRQETITLGTERLIYTVRRSRRAKHVLLQVDRAGQVEVVVPWWTPFHRAAELVREKKQWLQRQVRQKSIAPRRAPADLALRAAQEASYARQARLFFTPRAEAAAARLNVSIKKISIGNHKTQWGSCTPEGRLSFNWRLLLGPTWVAEYVVAHEVAHLVHHNHSQRYWALVAKMYPEYQKARRWLREHGDELRW